MGIHGGKGERSMKSYLRVRLVVSGVLALVFLWGIEYMVFLTNGQTKDQFEADMRTCAPAAMKEKAKQGLSDDDVKGVAVCMHGRGYSVAT